MDTRLYLDYWRRLRWHVALLIPCYAALMTVAVRSGESIFFLLGSWAMATFCWTFFVDLRLSRESRLLQTLPVSEATVGRTLWWAAVPTNALATGLVITAQVGGAMFVRLDRVSLSEHLPWMVTASFALSGGFYLFLVALRGGSGHAGWKGLAILLFAAYGGGVLGLAPRCADDNAARAFMIICGLLATVTSYSFAGRLVRPLLARRAVKWLGKAERRAWDGRFSVGWWDVIVASPLRRVVAVSWLIQLAPVALLGLAAMVTGDTKLWGAPWRLLLPVIAALGSLVLFSLGSSLDALRTLMGLPLRRRSVVTGVLVVPFVALAPLPLVFPISLHAALIIYTALAMVWLVVVAAALRWGRMGGVLALNIAGVILNFWPMMRLLNRDLAPTIDRVALSVLLALGLAAAGWIVWQLNRSNEPYRYAQTRFSGFLGQ